MRACPPNHSIQPVAPGGQEIVETIVFPSGKERNFITHAIKGVFRVIEEHWNTFVDELHQAYWSGSGPAHITDSLETAGSCALLGFTDSTPNATKRQR